MYLKNFDVKVFLYNKLPTSIAFDVIFNRMTKCNKVSQLHKPDEQTRSQSKGWDEFGKQTKLTLLAIFGQNESKKLRVL